MPSFVLGDGGISGTSGGRGIASPELDLLNGALPTGEEFTRCFGTSSSIKLESRELEDFNPSAEFDFLKSAFLVGRG